jgi:Zn-dependent peptidase ImmA (M78 family)/DNA-binding XRE family transcriptional regulator
MIAQRLRKIRLARNLSLEELATKMGGIVTKQAISKYEHDKAIPTPTVLTRLASSLGVNTTYFFTQPQIKVEFGAYRKGSNLLEKEKDRIKSAIEYDLENRVEILELLGQANDNKIPIQSMNVNEPNDAEKAAEQLRKQWELGLEPIQNITEILENKNICILNINSSGNFDGISARIYDQNDKLKTVALVTRTDIDVVRQRLNITHELGHLVLNINRLLDEEKIAFRFGAAFLAPQKKIIEEIGSRRSAIQFEELFLLKKRFGLSIQALIFRLMELEIINESYYWNLFNLINRLGWRKGEPEDWESEQSTWLEKNVLRLFTEGVIDKNTVKRIVGEKLSISFPESVIQLHEFTKLPLEKRRKILADQAEKIAKKYEELNVDIDGGDIVDY